MPTKATWLRFQTDGGFSFDFDLAEKLGRTVAEMRRTVSNEEYMQWYIRAARRIQDQELAGR